jgi:hypothetical protein
MVGWLSAAASDADVVNTSLTNSIQLYRGVPQWPFEQCDTPKCDGWIAPARLAQTFG